MYTDDPERAEILAVLIAKARDGEHHAFDRLVGRFQRRAVGYAASLLRGDLDRAEDAVQAAFLEAWRDLPSLRRSAAFAPWLRRIIFKHCDRIRRRDRPTVGLEAVAELPFPIDEERTSAGGAMAPLVAALPAGERIALLLVYVGGCSPRGAARYLGISAGAVKERLSSARRRLRRKGRIMVEAERGSDWDGEAWAVDPVEAVVLWQEIGAIYERTCGAFATLASVEEVESILSQHTDDYTLIFPEGFDIPDWDLAACRENLLAAVGTRPPDWWMGAVPEGILSVERDPSTGTVSRVVLRTTYVKKGFYNRGPIPRIDSWVRTVDGWKMQRTLSLLERE